MKVVKRRKPNNGIAKIQLNRSAGKARVTTKPVKNKDGKVVRKSQEFTLELEKCPDNIQAGVLYVQMNADGNEMWSVRPVNAVVSLRFTGFSAQKDKQPVPVTKSATKDGNTYTFQTFVANFEITKGKYQGMSVPMSMSYNFVKDPETGNAGISDSKYSKQLIEFANVTGIAQKNIPYKENLLPMLQKLALRNNREFAGSIRNGWLESVYDDEAAFDGEEFE